MKILYVAPRYHTNQVPIMEGFLKAGDEVTFVSQYRSSTEDYSMLKPVVLGYPAYFRFLLSCYKGMKKIMGKTGKEFVIQSKFGPLPAGRFRKILKEKKPDLVVMRDRSVYNIGVTWVCRRMKIPALLYTQSPYWEDVEEKGGAVRAFFRANTPKMRITPGKREHITCRLSWSRILRRKKSPTFWMIRCRFWVSGSMRGRNAMKCCCS